MRILKAVLAIFLLLCMTLVVVYTFFLDQGVVFLLRQSGVDGVRLQGLNIGFDSVAIEDFSAVILLSSGDRLSLEAKDTVVQYDIQQLLQQVKGRKIDIGELRLTLKRGPVAVPAPLKFPETIVLLKEELRSRLPLSTLQIKKLQLLGDFPELLLKKDIQIEVAVHSGELQMKLLVRPGPEIVAELTLQSPDSGHATATISIEAKGGTTLRGELQLTPDKVSGRVDSSLQDFRELMMLGGSAPIFPDMDANVSLQLDLPLGTAPDRALLLTVTATDFESAQLASSSLRLHLAAVPVSGGVDLGRASAIVFKQLRGHGFDIEKLSLGLGGSFRYQPGGFAIRLFKEQNLVATNIKVSSTELVDVKLGLENPLQFRMDNGNWSVADNALVVAPLVIVRQGRTLESGPLRCEFSGLSRSFSEPGLSLTVTSPRLAYADSEQSLSVLDFSGVVQRVGQRLNGQLQFVPESFGGQVQLQFHHGLASGRGKFSLDTTKAIEFDGAGALLSSLKKNWSYPFDLESGKLMLQVQGNYGPQQEPEIAVQIALSEGNGYAKEFLFKGLSLQQQFSITPDFKVQGGGSVALDHLVGGLDTYDIRADLVISASEGGGLPLLELDNFQASLLGGSLTSSVVSYDLNSRKSDFVVKIKGMNLASVVDLVKMDTLLVTGDVGGTIPVRIESGEITVADAELHSEGAGGEIRYTSGMMGQTGITGYALKAVENLQYEKLTVNADYAPSGVLDLLISIRGTSPGLNTTRPVQLNINAEQNLPALLKSLRFSKGLTDELDKRVKRHYN